MVSTQHSRTLDSNRPRLRRQQFAAGDVIIRQDAPSDYFYIIVSGEVDVVREESDGAELHVTSLGKSAYFGEIGLLQGAPRTATVRARTAVDVIVMDRQAFQSWLEHSPKSYKTVEQAAYHRRQDTSRVSLAHVLGRLRASRT